MARVKKKLKRSDIKRNVSSSVGHTIKKIKENERKYTIIFVLSFMIIFAFIGYFTLTIHTQESLFSMSVASSIQSSAPTILLQSTDIKTEEEALSSLAYPIRIQNTTNHHLKYRISFLEDKKSQSICGCETSFHPEQIYFSLNRRDIQTLPEDGLLESGLLMPHEEKVLPITIWINDTTQSLSDIHFHGYFLFEEI